MPRNAAKFLAKIKSLFAYSQTFPYLHGLIARPKNAFFLKLLITLKMVTQVSHFPTRIKSGEPGSAVLSSHKGLVESFARPKVQPQGLLKRLH